jgi:hypothetical protein
MLGWTAAAEQFKWAQMRRLSDNVHNTDRACALVPWIDVRSDAERRAFEEGVPDALALV